ncbi:MAG: hypothetical protein GY798_05565 [Hyphomicrobiales bacterium]|nr:hypothetical protein [Hyphomicrobiales bacterium]
MTDAGQREPTPRRPEFELPEIVELTIRRAPFEAPRLRHFESSLSRFDEAIEFHVRTNEPLPYLDEPPMLYVGETLVTEMRGTGEREYTFFAFDEERLEEGAPIAFGFPGTPSAQRRDSEYRYHAPRGS